MISVLNMYNYSSVDLQIFAHILCLEFYLSFIKMYCFCFVFDLLSLLLGINFEYVNKISASSPEAGSKVFLMACRC